MPVEPITLKWLIARCDQPDCEWESNPTPNEADANASLVFHLAEVHEEEGATDAAGT